MNIGENIKALRKLNNLKQSDLGKLLHVSNKAISSWEKNRTEPNIGMIEEMCKVFNCKKTDIIDGLQPPVETGGPELKSNPYRLTPYEYQIILAYRKADSVDKNSVDRILGLENMKKNASFTA